MIDWNAQVTEHFDWREMVTGSTPAIISRRRQALASTLYGQLCLTMVCEVLEQLRTECGNKPIRITSAFRGPASRLSSQHEVGQAADVQIDGLTPLEILQALDRLAPVAKHRLRQVIAETQTTNAHDLDKPISEGCGRWVHVAVCAPVGGPVPRWELVPEKAWMTGVRLPDGSYVYRTVR